MDKCLYAYREEIISLPGSALYKIINASCTINTQQELPFYALYMRKTITLSLSLFCSKLSGSQQRPLPCPWSCLVQVRAAAASACPHHQGSLALVCLSTPREKEIRRNKKKSESHEA